MSRPVGVTASAIVVVLGSLLALLLAVLSAASLFMSPRQLQPPNTGQFVIMGAVMFAALAGLGIWTAVGLIRLRPWARMSVLVFAGFLAVGCIFGLVGTMVLRMPPGITADTEQAFRRGTQVMFGVPLAIGLWWILQFNTHSARAAFASAAGEPASARPLSITIIGWASLVGVASSVLLILTRAPVYLFGAIFNGWIAGVIYAIFGALSLYIGKGLLDLRERARIVAIGWFAFSLVHMSVVLLVPTLRARMLELQRGMEQNQANPVPFDQVMFTNVVLAFTAISVGLAIWFLVRNRPAFVRLESV